MEELYRKRQANDLQARILLTSLSMRVALDAEAFRVLQHAEMYLLDRKAYQTNRVGELDR